MAIQKQKNNKVIKKERKSNSLSSKKEMDSKSQKIDPPVMTFFQNRDFTKREKVAEYDPVIRDIIVDGKLVRHSTNGDKVLEFMYEPLLDKNTYNRICKMYKLGENLYNTLSNIYCILNSQCFKWYKDISYVKNTFDFTYQIERYKNFIQDEHSCPIIKYVDQGKIQNTEFLKYFEIMLRRAKANDISSVNNLLYDKIKEKPKDSMPNPTTLKLHESITNIVYYRFLNYLEKQHRIQLSKTKTPKLVLGEKSLKSKMDEVNLGVLYDRLVKCKFIHNTSLNTFINCLSGNQVFRYERIVWNKSKSQGYYLFSKISDNFTIARLNNSVGCNKGEFDSNNKPALGYADIDKLCEDLL